MVIMMIVHVRKIQHVFLIGEAGCALMLRGPVDHERLGVSACVDRAAARVYWKDMGGAALGVNGQPAIVHREGDISNLNQVYF